ncbi:MAG TPA: ABC transporter permease [Planctomycetota bacterium]|nr:ABC transporter permease [Planctomycetota bacterium]
MLLSRSFRKFRKSKLALAAAAGIALYLAIGIGIFGGLVTREEAFERVGPDSVPGFGAEQKPEKRFGDVDFEMTLVERALKRKDPERALEETMLGHRRPAAVPVEELRKRLDAAFEIYDELEESKDLNREPELWPKLAELETAAARLWQPLEGWDTFSQHTKLVLGTDRQGRSILLRAVYAIKIALQVGVIVGISAVLFGTALGAAAAFYGGWVDIVVQWLYSTLSSVPYLVLLSVLVFMFQGSAVEQSLMPLYAAFGLTFWIGPCRVVRGEVLKIKQLDYVHAATALGQRRWRILLKHVIPNVSHLMLVQFSLLFISAIKAEVVLTFLGLGVKDEPSWGIMISQAKQEVVNGFFWQIGAATAAMFGLVLAFNIFTDALQDALDPKHIA